MLNKDQVHGKIAKAKGNIKQAIGAVAHSPKLKAEGQREELAGKIQDSFGTAKAKVSAAIKELGQKLKS